MQENLENNAAVEEKPKSKTARTRNDHITPDDSFDWDAYEKSQSMRVNQALYEEFGVKCYYHGDDAREVLAKYEGKEVDLDLPSIGEIREGRVIQLNEDYALVDINSTQEVYVDLKKEASRYMVELIPGKTVQVQIVSKNEYLRGSYTHAVNTSKEREILDSIGEPVAYNAKVTELTSAGYFLDIDGIQVFMPGSLGGVNKLHDFSVLLHKEILVMPINYTKGMIVVSHRHYLKTLIPDALNEVKNNIREQYTGFVTGTAKFGVFCEFKGCLTGMIHPSDLSPELQEKFKNREIKPGDEISFYIKEIVGQVPKLRIILTQNKVVDAWDSFNPQIPSTVQGKITAVKDYGAFIQLEKGISGLLSNRSYNGKVAITEGAVIDVVINKVDAGAKKVYLSLP